MAKAIPGTQAPTPRETQTHGLTPETGDVTDAVDVDCYSLRLYADRINPTTEQLLEWADADREHYELVDAWLARVKRGEIPPFGVGGDDARPR